MPESPRRGLHLAANVFDVWTFRRSGGDVEFLLLYTSKEKATRHFNGGRFWQIPSNAVGDGESVTDAVRRLLEGFGLQARRVWAGEHAYLIYNRRFENMQAIAVFAAEVGDAPVRLDPVEHAEHVWLPMEACLERVHYRGLKDGLRSVHEYVTGVPEPARELLLYEAP
ncbi:MAG: NUDIX domain-containing protein [Vicinamibacterales bacterium]